MNVNYFGHNITLKTTIALLDFFNNLKVYKFDENNNKLEAYRVPIQFASSEAYKSIIDNNALKTDLNDSPQPVEMDLITPRIACSLTSFTYDSSRKLNKVNKVQYPDRSDQKFTYMPVPYNITYNLSIITKTLFDMFQIVEQIIPFFSPSVSVDIKLNNSLPAESVPILLDSIDFEIPEDYDILETRLILCNMALTMKVNYYLPERDGHIIKKVDLNYFDYDLYKKFIEYTATVVNPEPITDEDHRDEEPVTETYEEFE